MFVAHCFFPSLELCAVLSKGVMLLHLSTVYVVLSFLVTRSCLPFPNCGDCRHALRDLHSRVRGCYCHLWAFWGRVLKRDLRFCFLMVPESTDSGLKLLFLAFG